MNSVNGMRREVGSRGGCSHDHVLAVEWEPAVQQWRPVRNVFRSPAHLLIALDPRPPDLGSFTLKIITLHLFGDATGRPSRLLSGSVGPARAGNGRSPLATSENGPYPTICCLA
jgi:hypothetical protein